MIVVNQAKKQANPSKFRCRAISSFTKLSGIAMITAAVLSLTINNPRGGLLKPVAYRVKKNLEPN